MATTVDIRDQVSGALKAMSAELSPSQVNPAIGRAESLLFQKHFLGLGTNKRGWTSLGFWPGAARATNFQIVADGVMVSVNKQGVRQRYKGGVIRPTNGHKYLTIPARQEAYGRRAGEFGRADSNTGTGLRVAFGRNGPYALVQQAASEVSFGKRRRDGSRNVKVGREFGGVMFWLVKEVKQEANPDVIPSDEEIISTAVEQVRAASDRAMRRGGSK